MIEKKDTNKLAVNIQKVENKIVAIRNIEVIADADVAELYGVETKRVNEAVKNNPDKFPGTYMFELSKSELCDLRSKISTTNVSAMSRNPTKVFTERGLYMLATILKGDCARDMTFAIIETFVKVRELKRANSSSVVIDMGRHLCPDHREYYEEVLESRHMANLLRK